jgi:hypothetical protein
VIMEEMKRVDLLPFLVEILTITFWNISCNAQATTRRNPPPSWHSGASRAPAPILYSSTSRSGGSLAAARRVGRGAEKKPANLVLSGLQCTRTVQRVRGPDHCRGSSGAGEAAAQRSAPESLLAPRSSKAVPPFVGGAVLALIRMKRVCPILNPSRPGRGQRIWSEIQRMRFQSPQGVRT